MVDTTEPLSKTEEEMFALTGENALDDAEAKNRGAIYKVIGDDKIPISKEAGKMWCSRKDSGIKRRDRFSDAWDEAIRYYNHDHTTGSEQQTTKGVRKRGDETENLVFSNTSTLMPVLYNRNPNFEFTNLASGEEEQEEDMYASVLEKVINAICQRKVAPGINLKAKVRKTTLFGLLCNIGWLKLNWTMKADSSDAAMIELEKLSEAYQKAKTKEEIIEVEGKLRALEDVFNLAMPSGPNIKCIHPKRIIVDADTEDLSGLSDCMWMMEEDFLPTTYINARYMEEEKEGNKEKRSIYKPTHVMRSDNQGVNSDTMFASQFTALEDNPDYQKNGFASEEEFQSAQYTRVWYVWDRLMQRVYLYHDGDWTYPLWVWNRPLKISRFFPYFALGFHEGTDNLFAKGEVTYYLDQQDAINEINAQMAKSRRNLRTKTVYDSNKFKNVDVDSILNQDDKTAVGVQVGEGEKLEDYFHEITPPEVKFKDLFDKGDKYAAINRLAGITETLQGAQLRTNTTQDAVHAMQDATQTRLDEKIDKIEELVADIAYTICELAVQNFEAEDVEQLCGTWAAKYWKKMSLEEFNKSYSIVIVPGSTEKPTSKVKQQMALQMGQVLGQYANASPAVIMVLLKVLEKAFSDVIIDEEDWEMIKQAVQAAIQQQQAPPAGAAPQAQQGPHPAEAQLAEHQAAEEKRKRPSLGDIDLQKLFKTVMKVLPPEMKQQLEATVKQGLTPTDALMKLTEGMQQ